MDWQLTCRVCLESGEMVSLFDWDENNEQLSEKYEACSGIQVTKNDQLPILICLNCVDRLTYAYQFKQQCISSNETLKECLSEFLKTSSSVTTGSSGTTETEKISIKQENGMLLQYELPVINENQAKWTRTLVKTPTNAVVTKSAAPKHRSRGRPRKYPDESGQIESSPYQRKKPRPQKKEEESLTTIIEANSLDPKELKEEPLDQLDDDVFGGDTPDDPDFEPTEIEVEIEKPAPKKRGRPRKNETKVPKKEKEDEEDMLLKETIMAYSEPIPEHILQPKKKSKPNPNAPKKKYVYEKSHICETCGAAFRSNASLQAHIRRHLGIKPFVCSLCGYACVLNMELRRHMMRHTGARPYKCRICERRFGDYGSRQKHERLHMGIRPYQCSLCGKAFTYSYVLANHMLTHTGEKKYACAPCNKKFTKAHHLKYHNKVHHKELYLKQQMEAEAKKLQTQMPMSGINLQLEQEIRERQAADNEAESQMQVVEEQIQEDSEQETESAVAGMQAVVMEDYSIENDDSEPDGHELILS